ncbi:TIGR02186 family protein [Rhodobacter sp. Har01]|uniref:TIGR02186 family protein n=1 Tax=Rhodobacter sp. Har01 TaxID=2883999 RepID=UPI001D082910|nr:TIGR02186 family protein [Rhodobacter sp. Har01]MCB6179227.1 TIGR02186 family protein [Rhodobacter sp. Har01]
MIRALAPLLIALALPVLAQDAAAPKPETIVSGLSQNRVAITADFDGSEILVYGAIKREFPVPEGRVDVIITVEGPSGPVTVRRKERVAGIWINNASVRVDSAPSFYAVATSGELATSLSATENIRHNITIDRVIRAVGIASEADASADFVHALVRVRSDEGRYRLLENKVQLTESTLFRTDVALPANLIEGTYKVRMFVLREGRVVAVQERFIGVRKAGLERLIFNLSREQPLAYGLISLVLAAFAGWAASAAFRFIRI